MTCGRALLFSLTVFSAAAQQTKFDYNTQIRNTPMFSDASYRTLALACAATGGGTLSVTQRWLALSSQTIGCNLSFAGGSIQPAAGQTVKVAGALFAPEGVQAFDISQGGTVIIVPGVIGELTPQMWGAKGDGQHDDTVAVNAAITAAIQSGIVLRLMPGVYLCNTVTNGVILNILSNTTPGISNALGYPAGSVGDRTTTGLTIRGAGVGRSIIKTTSASGADLMAAISNSGTIYYPHYSLSDFSLYGPDVDSTAATPICPFSMGTPGVSGNGLRITGTNSNKTEIRNIQAYYFCGAGKAGLWLEVAEESRVADIESRYSNIGLKTTTDANASIFHGVKLDSNYTGGIIQWAGAAVFTGLEVQSNCQNGLQLILSGGLTLSSPYFENNGFCPGGPWHGLYLNYVTDSYITGGNFSSVRDDIYLDSTTVQPGVVRPPVNSRNHIQIGAPPAFQAGAKITLNGSGSAGNVWEGALLSWFASDPTATETVINPVLAYGAAPSSILTPLINAKQIQVNGQTITPSTTNITVLPSGTTTIDCTLGGTFYTNNSTPTTIDFTSGCTNNQSIWILPGDANTSFGTGVSGVGRIVVYGPNPMKTVQLSMYHITYDGGSGIALMDPVNYKTGVTAGAYGDATHIPQFTVDAMGHLTVAGSIATGGMTSGVVVRNSAGTGTCQIDFTNGIFTGSTC